MMTMRLPKGGVRIVFSVLAVCLVTGIFLRFSERASSQQNAASARHGILAATSQSVNWFGQPRETVAQPDRGSNPTGEAKSKKLKSSAGQEVQTGTLEKMIVANGSAAMEINLNRLNGVNAQTQNNTLRFTAVPDSFFKILVFNGELRGVLPSAMGLIPQDLVPLPATLTASYQQLVVESLPWGGPYELVIRDGKTGFVFFNIEGQKYEYAAGEHVLGINEGRLLISKEFATALGHPSQAGSLVGNITITVTMRPTEVTRIVDGDVKSVDLPSLNRPEAGTVPGPDVIVGDLSGLAQFGSSSGTQVGLAVGTDSCNFGVENLHWFQNPDNDHPVIPQNLYRMSGGASNNDRFEQVGQSSVKHAFTALTNNICNLGCNGVGGPNLGSGCSDPYSASLNSGPSLGSRAWINPFTGAYPRNDSATPNNSHTGHTHLGPSHRILTEISDLNTTLNPGATYFAESQYITPHEYAWCQTHPGQCNMNNNVSYRQYNVTGTASPFSFSSAGSTQRTKAAINAWTGATLVSIQPDAANDGIGVVGYKVTNPSAGVWHYEYAIYNQNIDRAIQSFSIPMGAGVTVSNVGFHAPPQQPGWAADGTVGNTGFSSTPWAQSQDSSSISWSSESFAANPNANAVRWGTLYNVRFDSNRPPANMNATIGFLKTGSPITVAIQGPSAVTVIKSRADFDGDGKTDVSVFRPSEGNWYLSRSTAGFGVITFGSAGDRLVPGDFDGDGKADAAVFRPSTTPGAPDFYILNSSNSSVVGAEWGTTGDIPVSGDYDGDGKTDLAVWRPSNATWYIRNSATGTTTTEPFGLNGDVPLAMDYEADGKTNLAVFRPSNNTWYVAKPTGIPATNFFVISFGLAGDMPVPADYDNDNKDDVAMFRPSNGTWYVLRSSNGVTQSTAYGTSGDVPVPGDYDGDGTDDLAVYRGGIWYINRSTAGALSQAFGLGTDLAVPKQYIP